MRTFPVALLLVAACSQGAETNNSAEQANAAGAETADENSLGNIVSAPSETAATNVAAPSTNVAPANNSMAAAPTADEANAIPASFRGRWGMGIEECTAPAGLAKGLLTIEPKRVVFYEARGAVKSVESASPRSVSFSANYEGEGLTWSKRGSFTMIGDGRLRYKELEKYGSTFDYVRCPT